MSNTYNVEVLQSALTATLLGGRIEIYPQVGSTNDLLREAARRGEPEGLVIIADEQVAGRGRLGRVWTAPPGCCILCSTLLRPRFSPQYAFYLTIATSLAIYRAITRLDQKAEGRRQKAEAPGQEPKSKIQNPKSKIAIKWPNDVLLGGRKVSGVLCESEFTGGDWAFAVVGFGINVNLRPDQLGDLREAATSLSIEWGHDVDRAVLLAQVLAELESLYFLLQSGQFSTVHTEWVAALETIGKRVTVHEVGSAVTGIALRADRDGALILRLDAGGEHRVLAGDVTPVHSP
ncbi:MAG TPA: biotin--[acetyl-CoA-carboxylase] ligase [Chloroflexia bacterium]|nr:biotin--[acetyl-CoA-carboxylase] ligase [Chloroflexia bacterium]